MRSFAPSRTTRPGRTSPATSVGRADLSGGYVTVVLGRLERQGWLESEWEGIDLEAAGRPQRRAYRLSATGRSAVVRAHEHGPASAESRTPRDASMDLHADRVELAGTLCDLAADAFQSPIASGTAPNGVLTSPPIRSASSTR